MTIGRSIYFRAAVIICVCILATLAGMHFSVYIYPATTAETMNMKLRMRQTYELKCLVDAILCGGEKFEKDANSSNLDTLRSEFHRLMTTIDFQCPTLRHFGRTEIDGGYDACWTKTLQPDNNSCLVYSFGIRQDWSFDEAWAKFGCEVHSFDPSIGKEDHIHAPNISFHNLGLWGSDYTNLIGWKLERLSTIKKRLGHKKRIIDILKIDVEGAEWPFLRDVVYTEPTSLSNIRQLYLEIHTPKLKSEKSMTATDFAEINYYVKLLREEQNFQLYKNGQNYSCCGRFSRLMPPGVREQCCHEVFYFNAHLLTI